MNRRYSIAASASQNLERISEYYASLSIEAGEVKTSKHCYGKILN